MRGEELSVRLPVYVCVYICVCEYMHVYRFGYMDKMFAFIRLVSCSVPLSDTLFTFPLV